MPSAPDLSPPTCSSQECLINVTQSVRVETLEVQYRSEADGWTSLPDSVRGVLGNLSGLFFDEEAELEALKPQRGLLIQSQRQR